MAVSAAIVLVLISSAFAAVPVPNSARIVGGTSTTVDEYPYIASVDLFFNVIWYQSCGGTLITPRSILSAAHCFLVGDFGIIYRARLGSSFKSFGGQLHEAAEIIPHEDYDSLTLFHDIAIMTLATRVTLGDTVQVARLPPAGYSIPDNQRVTAAGWGRLWTNGPTPEQLQHVDIYVISEQICEERYSPMKMNGTMLCAGILDVGGKDACQQDSGGPVALKTADGHVIVGVTSWSLGGCADSFYPGVNARTSYYHDWIVKHGMLTL